MSTEAIIFLASTIIPFVLGLWGTIVTPDEKVDGFIIIFLVPLVNLLIVPVVWINYFDTRKGLMIKCNTVRECKQCGLYTRRGYLMNDIAKGQDGNCPHCDYQWFTNAPVDSKADISISKKLSWRDIKRMMDGKSEYHLKQIERDQEEKMRKLSKEKGK